MSGRTCHPFLHVNRRGTLVAKALVQAAVVVEVENTARVLVHVLLLHAAPQAFDVDVAERTT